MKGRIKINEDNIVVWLMAASLLLSVLLAGVTAFAVSPRFGLSLLAGGVLATANFLWIRRGLEAAITMLPSNASRFALMRYFLRLAIMACLLYLLIVRLHADIFGLIIGLSVLVLNIIGFSIYLSTRKGG
jgi:hypothetical protein